MAPPQTPNPLTEGASLHRIYCLLLIGAAYACVVGFGLYGRQFEPLTGDLTRIGWFAENEFGGVPPQQRFAPPLPPPASLAGSYDLHAARDRLPPQRGDPRTALPHALPRDTRLAG